LLRVRAECHGKGCLGFADLPQDVGRGTATGGDFSECQVSLDIQPKTLARQWCGRFNRLPFPEDRVKGDFPSRRRFARLCGKPSRLDGGEKLVPFIGSSPKRVGNFVTFFQLEIYIRGFSEAWLRCPMAACCIVVPKLI